jgi:hypothetical protein
MKGLGLGLPSPQAERFIPGNAWLVPWQSNGLLRSRTLNGSGE